MAVALIIASLAGIALYLGKRWSEANAANVVLQAQIDSLKRQLRRSR
jgi:Tfp pilus assembly protein PilN